MTTDITEHIIVVLHGDNWEADLKSLATENPLQDWLQLARDIKREKYVIREESWLLRTRIQILLVDAGRITNEAYIAAVSVE